MAEILILRTMLLLGRKALLVEPYVALCAEKAESLRRLWAPLNVSVMGLYGGHSGSELFASSSSGPILAVCTIEKANMVLNRLLDEDRLHEIGIVVVDEMHMVQVYYI